MTKVSTNKRITTVHNSPRLNSSQTKDALTAGKKSQLTTEINRFLAEHEAQGIPDNLMIDFVSLKKLVDDQKTDTDVIQQFKAYLESLLSNSLDHLDQRNEHEMLHTETGGQAVSEVKADIEAQLNQAQQMTATNAIIPSIANGYCGPNSVLLGLAQLTDTQLDSIENDTNKAIINFVKANRDDENKLQREGRHLLEKFFGAKLYWASIDELYSLTNQLGIRLLMSIKGTKDIYDLPSRFRKEDRVPTICIATREEVGHYDAMRIADALKKEADLERTI